MDGWIKLYRSLMAWEWYKDPNTLVVFIHCLIRANYENQRFMGVDIPKGSFVSSYRHLADETGISVQSVRTAIKHLISTHELTQCSYSKFTVFTVVNWDKYQSDQHDEQQTTNKQLTSNQQQYKKERKKEVKNMYTDQRIYDYDALQKKLANK